MSTSTSKNGAILYPILIIVACCALMTTGIAIPLNCAGFFYGPVTKELGTGTGAFTIYMTIQFVVMSLMLPMAGKLLSTKDIRVVLSTAVLLYGLSFGAMSFCTSLYQFYLAGAFMGIAGSAIVYLPVPILINSWFKEKVGLAMGLAYAFIGLGGAIFSPITGYLITSYGWRTGYLALGIIMAVVSLPFTIFIIRRKPEELGLQAYGYKAATGENIVASDDSGVTKDAALKMPAFYMTFVFTGLLGLISAIMYHLPQYITTSGFTTAIAATCMSAGMIGTTCGKILIGHLNDRLGVALAAPIGILAGFVGIVTVIFGGNPTLLSIGVFLFGIGYSCTVLEPPLVVKSIFGNRDYSVIYSRIMMASSMGTAFGASLLGFLKDVTHTYLTSLVVVLAMQFIATVLVTIAMRSKTSL